MEDKALKNHVIKSYQGVLDHEMCELNCYLEPNCVSYNFGQLNDGNFLCEVSNSSHLQVPSNDLEERDQFVYSQIFKVSNMDGKAIS